MSGKTCCSGESCCKRLMSSAPMEQNASTMSMHISKEEEEVGGSMRLKEASVRLKQCLLHKSSNTRTISFFRRRVRISFPLGCRSGRLLSCDML
jgi:hypothetical protein